MKAIICQAGLLNAMGVILLLSGLGSAVLVYRLGQAPAIRPTAPGEWQDGSLSMSDSKTATRDIELYGGKVEVLLVRWQERLQRPASLAVLIATISTLSALGCFLVARRLARFAGAGHS